MEKINTIFISGIFNVLHPGHQRIIKYAHELANNLVVGVFSDSKAGNKAIISEEYRLEGVRNNIYVTQAFILDEDVEDYLRSAKPEVVLKGKEWEFKKNKELEPVQEYGGRLIFSSGGPIFSSQELINQSSNIDLTFDNEYFSERFSNRHDFTRNRLLNLLERFEDLKICVIGDLIIDEYIACAPLGMSQEDPTIVVMPTDKARFLGGAGIVAMHAANLGSEVNLLSVTGDDFEREYVLKELASQKLFSTIAKDKSRLTTLKQRFQAEGKNLLKVSHLSQDSINEDIQKFLFEAFESILDKVDLVVFSDFNYGCLPQKLVDKLIKKSKNANKFIVADSQSSSQVGDISRFKDMDIIFATEREARVCLQNSEDGLVVLAEKLKIKANANNVFLKLGAQGVLLHIDSQGEIENYETDRLDAINKSPKDTAGAGDSMLITSSLAIAAGANHWEAACLGNIAASIQVGRVGNIPLTLEEFKKVLNN
jgi:rfaE bifunctional protein kinase chain/domain